MKVLNILLSLAFSFLYCNGRTIIEKSLESALIEIQYERTMSLDTLRGMEDTKVDILTLKCGERYSNFYSAILKTNDSTEFHNREFALARLSDLELCKTISRLPNEIIIKYYNEKMIRTLDRFDLSNWIIDEEMEKPKWIINDSIKNILGYECIKAETSFRGRTWIVWFSPEIPISDGPWKLWGLPGVILKAYDSNGHYIFDSISIKFNDIGNVEYYDYYSGNRLSIRRDKALPIKWKSLHTDLHYRIASSGMYGLITTNLVERKDIPHTNYDFEETDYIHE